MKLKLLILVLALQSAWLLGMVAMQEHALATGKVILLETGALTRVTCSGAIISS